VLESSTESRDVARAAAPPTRTRRPERCAVGRSGGRPSPVARLDRAGVPRTRRSSAHSQPALFGSAIAAEAMRSVASMWLRGMPSTRGDMMGAAGDAREGDLETHWRDAKIMSIWMGGPGAAPARYRAVVLRCHHVLIRAQLLARARKASGAARLPNVDGPRGQCGGCPTHGQGWSRRIGRPPRRVLWSAGGLSVMGRLLAAHPRTAADPWGTGPSVTTHAPVARIAAPNPPRSRAI